MCFSATASFITAGVTGSVGIAALTRVTEPRQVPLAMAPILFALQQGVEGLLWLNLPLTPDRPASTGLAFLYIFIAEVFWPIYAPTTVLLSEPDERRRQLMLLCLAAGIGVGAYLFWWLMTRPYGAAILDGHIVYQTESQHPAAIALAYLAATSLPLILSSQRTLIHLGAIVLLGSTVAYAFYWDAFVSVWCFFAAAASVVILYHFDWSRRLRPRMLGA